MGKLASPKKNGRAFSNVNGALKTDNLFFTRKRSNLISALALILFFSATAAYFFISPYISMAHFGEQLIEAARKTSLASFLPDHPRHLEASRTPLSIAIHDERALLIPDAIVEFLKAYSLSKYENAFFDAIRFGQFKRVAQEIYRTSGYELIRLDHVPEFIRNTHVVLSSPLGPQGIMSHFLFWRPLFRMNKFYYSYKGHEVYLLQKKLASLNLFDQHANGIVGPDLLAAVVQFQKQMAMEITGYPDDRTVFLICQLAQKTTGILESESLEY